MNAEYQMNEAIYITVDGTTESKNVAPTLEEAQAFVGGFIELVVPQGDRRCQLLMNEEGIRLKLDTNITGTALYQRGAILGNIILLYGNCKWT